MKIAAIPTTIVNAEFELDRGFAPEMTRDGLRTYVPFQSGWRMRIDHPYSLWVRDRELCWSCGQCPLDPDGQVMAPGDFLAQTRYVASLIEQSLRSRQLRNAHVAKLVVYYVPDATSDQHLLNWWNNLA